jgi:uncharacterized delta-60 repeat protein
MNRFAFALAFSFLPLLLTAQDKEPEPFLQNELSIGIGVGFPLEKHRGDHRFFKASHSLSDSVQVAWINHYASGLVSGQDRATAIAVDSEGNVYATGYSYNSGNNTDYATIKYNSDGIEQWVSLYNGSGNSGDMATAIMVDDFGNVYVTGESWGTGTEYDYATIKYSSNGVEQWVARYNGPGNGYDQPTAIAVDDFDYVYVTGSSSSTGTEKDYTTIKYNSAGVEQWTVQYDGPGNHNDVAVDIDVDDSGNVFVTGYSWGDTSAIDFATVKYNSDGIEQWVKRFNGVENGSDDATGLAIDHLNNIYVTGVSTGSGTGGDYTTIKYNSDGIQQWIARYNGPDSLLDRAVAIVVDSSGNTFVTGYSEESFINNDYATIKYNSSGDEQWVARYNGPANSSDEPKDIALDNSGNVYVTGISFDLYTHSDYTTIKYDSAGVELWVARYNGPETVSDEVAALAVGDSGNVFVTGGSPGFSTLGTNFDYATVKYNAGGIEQWVVRYTGPGNSLDRATAMAVDTAGNIYVTGYSTNYLTGKDYATIKYNSLGAQQWVVRYNGPGNHNDEAIAIAVDYSGNVYVTGSSWGSGTSTDYATIKYNSDGIEQWVARYNDSGEGATALAIDGHGNVYVTGYSGGDYATIKYSSDGIQQWMARYNGPGNSNDRANALAVDNAGNVYVTGVGFFSNRDYVTIKYNSNGVEQWVARYFGYGLTDVANTMAIDDSGNVIVTGSSWGSGTNEDYATVKYDSNGTEQWVARYNGPGNVVDRATAIVIDGLGSIIVTGQSMGSGTSSDYTTIKYNLAGFEQWIARYTGMYGDDAATAIAADGSDNIYVTGRSGGLTSDDDYATVKYNSDGIEKWVARYNGAANAIDNATALAVDNENNVYVTGYSETDFNHYSIYTTIKYVQILTSVEEEKRDIPEDYWLGQNYPNPFNPTTTIRYTLPNSQFVTLIIYDLLGREVATLVNEKQTAGRYSVNFDAIQLSSGLYFYKITAGSFSKVRKMMLIR